MKKPALFVLGLLLLAFISIYFIVPQNITFKSVIHIDATDINVARFVINQAQWKKWWPGDHSATDSTIYSYKGINFNLQKSTNSAIQVQIKKGGLLLDSHIIYLATDDGSTDVTWYGSALSSLNPFARIAQFVQIKLLQSDVHLALEQFKVFMQNDVNVYGIKVNLEKVTDPVMLATHTTTTRYPTTEKVYQMIADLKKQIAAKNANESNKPMLNIFKVDNNEYQVMAAIPVDKEISPEPNYVLNRMVKGGNILEADVKGGRNTIDNAFVQLKNYTKDHRLVSPAMPFELIVTDRLAEKDTAKWVTKIYYPIF